MNKGYRWTVNACFIGYIIQAIVNNFVPLLFLTFQSSYGIPLSRITLLITVNFAVQLMVDLASVSFVDRIGYRVSLLIAHAASALGLVGLGILPRVLPDAYAGLFVSVVCYAVGGGLLEVLVSPVMESCPTKNKEKAMSMLHSFYCWGHVGVVLASTLFFQIFGIGNWWILALLWAVVPVANGILFARVPIAPLIQEGENDDLRGGQRTGCQSVGLHLCGEGTGRRQDAGRSDGSHVLCPADGMCQGFLWQIRGKGRIGSFYDGERPALRGFLSVYLSGSRALDRSAGLWTMRSFRGYHVAGNLQ